MWVDIDGDRYMKEYCELPIPNTQWVKKSKYSVKVENNKVSEHMEQITLFLVRMLNRSHLNKGCYGMLYTSLKCNLANFDIPNGFP